MDKLLRFSMLVLAAVSEIDSTPHGYHYYRFSGPVSGPISQVQLPHTHNGGPTYDFVAKPDYQFSYGVEDPLTGNYQNQKEERDGDVVRGEYSLVGADGITRKVTYTADSVNGFQATVHTSPTADHVSRKGFHEEPNHGYHRSYETVEEAVESDDEPF